MATRKSISESPSSQEQNPTITSPSTMGLSQLPNLTVANPSNTPQLSIKLDDDNFLLWKNQMLNVIIAHGFEEFIDGSKPCPPRFLNVEEGEINPQYTVWQRYNVYL